MAEQRAEDFAAHAAMLRGEKVPMAPDVPLCGMFERRGQNGQRQPVYFFRGEDGEIEALAGTAEKGDFIKDGGKVGRLFSSVCDRPISFETWGEVYNTGKWPDDPAPAQSPPATADAPASSAAQGNGESATEPQVGPGDRASGTEADQPPAGTDALGNFTHNKPPTGRLAEISDQWAELRQPITKLLGAGIKTQADADRLGNLVEKVAALHKTGDTARLAETKPHRDAAAEINGKWNTMLGAIDGAIKKMKKPLAEFLTAEKKRRQEEAAIAVSQGADPADVAPAKVKAGGTSGGRAVRNVTVKYAEITDWNLLLGAVKDRPDVKDFVQAIANQAARSGIALAGCVIKEREEART